MIVVFGSLNMDVLMPLAALPRPGETVLCPGYELKPGGKGNNQAVAAARAGGRVAMYGRVGRDGFGAQLLDNLRADGIDADGVVLSDRPTGAAMICVDRAGENFIAVASGANLDASAGQVPADALGPGTTVLMQMEVPPQENWALVRRARQGGARTILNVAPAAPVPRDALDLLDVLVVNEHEAATVAAELGIGPREPAALARALAEAVGVDCIMTLGARGALAMAEGALWQVDPLRIEPVDTTGAGDAFCGVLAAALDGGLSMPDALRRATVGAALACLALGAQESLPRADAIAARLHEVPPPRRIA